MLKFYVDMIFKSKMSKLLSFWSSFQSPISRKKSHFDASMSLILLQQSLTQQSRTQTKRLHHIQLRFHYYVVLF